MRVSAVSISTQGPALDAQVDTVMRFIVVVVIKVVGLVDGAQRDLCCLQKALFLFRIGQAIRIVSEVKKPG